MIPDNARDIVLTLREKSREGKIPWEHPRHSIMADYYRAVLPDSSIQLTLWPKDLTERLPRIEFEVISDQGRAVFGFDTTESDTDWATMKDLLELAAYKANRIDDVLANLRDRLAKV